MEFMMDYEAGRNGFENARKWSSEISKRSLMHRRR